LAVEQAIAQFVGDDWTEAGLEAASPQAILQWALERWHPRVALACSFGAEDVVLVDMLAALRPDARVFMLDTARLHDEVYDVAERIRKRYGLTIEIYFPDAEAVEALARESGFYSFRDSIEARKQCCRVRKIEPLRRALSGLDAWITGLRREQSTTRTAVGKVELDQANGGIAKLNPLADWSEQQVWAYIAEHEVPYNALHDRGFPSIGCAPCTRAIAPGEDVRAGRWWWELPELKECGLHPAGLKEGKP